MKVALVNPDWRYDGSIYFGCREPHLPLELGAAAELLRQDGHEPLLLDAALDDLDTDGLVAAVVSFKPDVTVVTTAPTYLFWRCAPPELRCPADFLRALDRRGGVTVAVGPHGSATPHAALRKLGCDLVIRGECEEAILRLANGTRKEALAGAAYLSDGGEFRCNGSALATAFAGLPPLRWPEEWVGRHDHHHHRFGGGRRGLGAEVEASRGCPYACSFCAKIDFRDAYRRRDLRALMTEIDMLQSLGVGYIYFIDEIFLPWRKLLDELRVRDIAFGVQTRIDIWKPEMIRLLGEAGCVSVEAGVESITEEGRAGLDKDCRLSTEELTARLLAARDHIAFVQANLLEREEDDAAALDAWRDAMRSAGVWANDPVPLFPYPSSPDYRKLFGEPDDQAWERAHDHYLASFESFSDIQGGEPLPLNRLEAAL